MNGAKVQKDMASGWGLASPTPLPRGLIGNAILPSLLHQDPRYFYQGTGTKKSRALHAILAPFVCKGDNGAWQPNYSHVGRQFNCIFHFHGLLPRFESYGPGHVFRAFGIDMGLHVGGSLAQEFILDKFTSRGKHLVR